MRTVPSPTNHSDLEPMPAPTTPLEQRIALAASVLVLATTLGTCFVVVTPRIPPPDATTERAQEVVERFVIAACQRDTNSMAALLTGNARKTMDETVLSAIAEYVQRKVGTPAGFQRTDQQLITTGARQRLYLSVSVGGLVGKARVRSTLAYEGESWMIEAIEIR